MKILSVVLASIALSTPAFAEQISLAKAAELGCHRVERLVTLRKIDESFLNKFYALRVEQVNQGEAAYRFRGYQSQAGDGSSNQVEIFMKENGKAISHQVVAGGDGNAPAWPVKDPVTLMESALHYVLENGSSKPEVAPFYNELSEATLSQVQSGGDTLVQAAFKAASTSNTLIVLQGLDGTFISAEVK